MCWTLQCAVGRTIICKYLMQLHVLEYVDDTTMKCVDERSYAGACPWEQSVF